MGIRRIHLGESQPPPISVPYGMDGLLIIRTIYGPGMYVDTRIPERCSWADLESAHIQTLGEVYEVNGKRPGTGPGWMSRDDHLVVEPGDYRRVFRTPGEYWCCLWTAGRSCDDVGTVKVSTGEALDLEPGTNLFLVGGQVTLGERPIAAPRLLRVQSAGKQLVATTDSYAFTWKTR